MGVAKTGANGGARLGEEACSHSMMWSQGFEAQDVLAFCSPCDTAYAVSFLCPIGGIKLAVQERAANKEVCSM